MKDLFNVYCSLALALATSSSACAMIAPAAAVARCQVLDGEKLPAQSGGAAALCAAIERAVASSASDVAFTVQVTVGSLSMLSADVTLSDGRKLPSLRMAEMDRPISKSTFDRFGAAVASHIDGAHR